MFKGKRTHIILALGALLFIPNKINAQAQVEKGKWELKDNKWKYYNEKSELQKGWLDLKGDWYYLDKNTGDMLTGWQTIDGSTYYFDTKAEGIEGRMHTAWYKSPKGNWYFFNNDIKSSKLGIIRTGWQWIDGYCYYFETNPKDIGKMYLGKVGEYLLNSNGQWSDVSGKAFYVEGKGFNTKTSAIAKNIENKRVLSGAGGGTGRSSGSFGGGHSSGGYTGSLSSEQNNNTEKPKTEDLNKNQGIQDTKKTDKEQDIPREVDKGQGDDLSAKRPDAGKTDTPSVEKPNNSGVDKPNNSGVDKPNNSGVEKPNNSSDEKPNTEPETKKEENENIPARVEVWDGNEKLKDLNIDEAKFEKDNAHYRIYDVKLPHKYARLESSVTKFPDNALTVKVFNKKEKALNISVKGALFSTLHIKLNDFKDKRFTSGEISLRFSFEESDVPTEHTNNEQTNMEAVNIVVDGNAHTYYYKKYDKKKDNEILKVDGVDVTAKAEKILNYKTPVAYYYVKENEKLSGNIYGRATLRAADFYAAELTPTISFTKNLEPDANGSNFVVTGYIRSYVDVERRKTMKNYGAFINANYEKFKSEEGYFINGIKVPIQVDANLYAKAFIMSKLQELDEPGFTAKGPLLPIIKSLTSGDEVLEGENTENIKRTLSTTEPKVYKKLYSDGVLSALMYSGEAREIPVSGVVSTFTDQSSDPRFDYEIKLDNLPDSINVKENLLGVIMSVKSGRTDTNYGLMFDENVDADSNTLRFSVHRRAVGSGTHYTRYSKPSVAGKTINSITYLLSDNKKLVVDNLNIYVPKQLPANADINVTNNEGFASGEGAAIGLDISTIPYKDNISVANVYKVNGEEKTKLTEGDDYTFESNTLHLKDTSNTGSGTYRLILKDTNMTTGYVSIAKDIEVGTKAKADTGNAEDHNIDTGNLVTKVGEEEVIEPAEEEGEEATDYKYKASVEVTFDRSTGAITKVVDNTVPENSSKKYWTKVKNAKYIDKFVGKTKDNINEEDVVSGATWSSKAVIKAIKKAISDNSVAVNPTENERRETGTSTSDAPQTLGSTVGTITGKAQVDQWGYKAQILVTYNTDTGEIISVKDNNTNSGVHKPYWNTAKAMFKSFVGKHGTKDEIENVDNISGATYSSRAIKDAMRDAFHIDDDSLTSEGHF